MLFHTQLSEAEELSRLLDRLEADPDASDAVTASIHARFGRTVAIMILDMSGFSSTTRDGGIVTFLRKIHEMQGIVVPIVQEHAGQLVNTFADNLTCLFPDVPSALAVARVAIDKLEGVNRRRIAEEQCYASFGIGYGSTLVVGSSDIFGNQVNLAAKLGEDIAESFEVLLTEQAVAQLDEADHDLEWRAVTISGLDLRFAEVKRRIVGEA